MSNFFFVILPWELSFEPPKVGERNADSPAVPVLTGKTASSQTGMELKVWL
jgi:hypothetical protein